MSGIFGRTGELTAAGVFLDHAAERFGVLSCRPPRRRRSLRGFHRRAHERVSVQSLVAGGLSSRPAKARIRPVRPQRARQRRAR